MGGGVDRAPAIPLMRPAALHVTAPSYLLEEVRQLLHGGREAPPPGSVLGLGGLAMRRRDRRLWRLLMTSPPSGVCREDRALTGSSPPPPVAQASRSSRDGRSVQSPQHERQRDSDSSNSEEGELCNDPQEAAMESGQTADGSSRLRQPGKKTVSSLSKNAPRLVEENRNRGGGARQSTLGG